MTKVFKNIPYQLKIGALTLVGTAALVGCTKPENDNPDNQKQQKILALQTDSVRALNSMRTNIKLARESLLPIAQGEFDFFFNGACNDNNSGNPQLDTTAGSNNVYYVFKNNGGTNTEIDNMNISAQQFLDIYAKLQSTRSL